MSKARIAFLVAAFVMFSTAFAEDTKPKTVRLLATGNSFTRNATHYLPDIVKAGGDRLILKMITLSGAPISNHLNNAETYQRGGSNADAHAWALLKSEKWDFITFQQASMDSFKIETYRPHAKKLYDYMKSQAPGAAILIHETWAYREDDVLFKKDFTQGDMYWGLRNAYETIANELGCRIIPVGDAFQNARADSAWKGVFPDPKFDYKNAKYPDLPDQKYSLNTGYHWKMGNDDKRRLELDTHHANAAGEYLGAAVWYEFLFGHSVVGNKFIPPGLTVQDVAFLQRIAHQTVTEGIKPQKPVEKSSKE